MLEKKNLVNGFVAGLVAVVLLAFSPTSEAAIGFPGRNEATAPPAETQQTVQQEEADLPYIPQLAEMEAEAKASEERHEEPEQITQQVAQQVPNYPVLIAKAAKKGEETGIYEGTDLDAYFNAVGVKHRDKFFVYCATPELSSQLQAAFKKANFKVEEITKEGKVPQALDAQFCQAMGTEDVYAFEATFNDPNHKSWLSQNWTTVLGALSLFGI